MTALKSLEDLPSIGSVLGPREEQNAQISKTETGPSAPARQDDTDSENELPLIMRGLSPGPSSSRPKKAFLAKSSADEPNNATADSLSMLQSIHVPSPEDIVSADDNATPGWSSSVYSVDEDQEANPRRIYRVSSDDASSVYSNDESGVASAVGPAGDDEIARPVSPIMGLFEQTMAASRRGNNAAALGAGNMATQSHGVSSAGAMQLGHPMTDASRNTSFGSIIRQACSEDRDAPSSNAYPPAAHGRYNMITPAIRQTANNRQASGQSAASSSRVANYSRKGKVNIAMEPPYPPPSGPLPPTPDWKPVTARRPAYVPPPPKRVPPSVPAPPVIPLRKRPSLTSEELDTIAKKAGSALQTRVLAKPESFASGSNFRAEKPIHDSRTSPDFKVPDLVPEGLRIRKSRNDGTPPRLGQQEPRPLLATASTTQFDTARTQAGFRGYGNSRHPLATPSGSRIRPSTSQAQQIRPSASQVMPLSKENLDHIEQAYQRSLQFQRDNPLGQPSLHTSFNLYETIEDFSVPTYGSMPTKSNIHDGRMGTNRAPTPACFADSESPIQSDTKSTASALYTPAIVNAAGGASFKTTKAHEEYTMQQMLKDREEVIVASARLRAMGSGYFTQRATQRPKTPKVETTGPCPAPKSVEPVSESRPARADSPALVPRPASPTKGFKGKMQKVAEKLKLRKSSKNLREIKQTDTKASKASKASLGSSHDSKSHKGRSTPSLPLTRQRSGAELMVSEEDEIPPVPAIPLRHRKEFKQMEKGKGKARE